MNNPRHTKVTLLESEGEEFGRKASGCVGKVGNGMVLPNGTTGGLLFCDEALSYSDNCCGKISEAIDVYHWGTVGTTFGSGSAIQNQQVIAKLELLEKHDWVGIGKQHPSGMGRVDTLLKSNVEYAQTKKRMLAQLTKYQKAQDTYKKLKELVNGQSSGKSEGEASPGLRNNNNSLEEDINIRINKNNSGSKTSTGHVELDQLGFKTSTHQEHIGGGDLSGFMYADSILTSNVDETDYLAMFNQGFEPSNEMINDRSSKENVDNFFNIVNHSSSQQQHGDTKPTSSTTGDIPHHTQGFDGSS